MKKMIPVYILLAAILTVGILLLRKAEAMRGELAGIRSEQFKQPTTANTGLRPLKAGAIPLPVIVVNQP